MNTIDRVDWLDMAIRMQLSTIDWGRVRVIGSVALMKRMPDNYDMV